MSQPTSNSQENIDLLVSMGFSRNEATIALRRGHGDVEAAVDILSQGSAKDIDQDDDDNDDDDYNDAEFDLIATAQPEPTVHQPTVFHPRTQRDEVDHFREGSDTVGEMVDSRVSSLVSMGFPVADVEAALKRSNNDVNEALNILLSASS